MVDCDHRPVTCRNCKGHGYRPGVNMNTSERCFLCKGRRKVCPHVDEFGECQLAAQCAKESNQ